MNPSFPLEGGGKLHEVTSLAVYWVALFCIFLPLKLAVLFASAGLSVHQCQKQSGQQGKICIQFSLNEVPFLSGDTNLQCAK